MNYPILIIIILFLTPISAIVNGQEGNRDLTAEYCMNNWERDPVRCADYVPEDYEEKKTEYQAQELERIKQETAESKLAQESQRVCPLGSRLDTDIFGNQICVDSRTDEFVSYPNTGQDDLGNNELIIGIVVFIVIVAIIAGVIKSQGKSTGEQYARQDFPESVKRKILHAQKNRCNRCNRPIGQVGARLEYYDFDHIDGNSWNNDISNCQVLCKNCHAHKTARDS